MSTDSTNIEKFSGRMDKEDSGCTIIVNETIQGIKDLEVCGLYVYLCSRPPNWVICVQEIRNHSGLGKNKVYQLLNKLIELRLLKRTQEKNEKGVFNPFSYRLFLKPFEESNQMIETQSQSDFCPRPHLREAVFTGSGKTGKHIKQRINTKQRTKENNININNAREEILPSKSDWDNHTAMYEIAQKEQLTKMAAQISESEKSFQRFWEVYPVKKSEGRAKAAWISQNCYTIENQIIRKLREQLAKDSQYLDGYIPNPDKYILEQKWKDSIHVRKNKSGGLKNYDRNAIDWADGLLEDVF